MTTSSLFRHEALEHRKDRLYGDVILLQPLPLTVLVGVVVFVCAMVISILFWGSYARKETVPGYLVPDKGIVKIYAPQQGTISRVHVKDGEAVREGQTLFTVLSEHSLQGGNEIESTLLKEIEITQKQHQQRIQGHKSLSHSEESRLKTQIQGLEKELSQIEKTLVNQEDRVKMLEGRVQGAKKLLLNKNLSEMDYQKILDELLAQQQGYQNLLRTKGSTQNSLDQAKAELEQLPIKIESSISEVENKISELKQRYAEVEGRRALEIHAPINGAVTAVQAKEGQWLSANMPSLLAIIPKDSVLQVALYVPSRAIGFITPGQIVRIRYDAFPYRRFGVYEGTVTMISKHVLLPQELPIPMELKEPVYQVTVELKREEVEAYGKTFSLQAGMALEADIILDRQTLLEWVLDPLVSLRGKF